MIDFVIIGELLIIVLIVVYQFKFYFSTKRLIDDLPLVFPSHLSAESLKTESVEGLDDAIKVLNNYDGYSPSFREILSATNAYLRNNMGSVDFQILQNISERVSESKEQQVSSNISLPLYIGLMGTFVGIVLGLSKIAWLGVQDDSIQSFIVGVLIAMVGSLIGLLLTVVNSSRNFRNAQIERDIRKNRYYNFLQSELLPHLGNNLFQALDKLRHNLNSFNSGFGENLFEFNQGFKNNVIDLSKSVSSISANLGIINKNTQIQADFLNKLDKIGYNRMASANIAVFNKLEEVLPLFTRFVDTQRDFTNSLSDISEIAKLLHNTINRLQKFEENLNLVGEGLVQSDIVGSQLLRQVERQVFELESKHNLIKEYAFKHEDQFKEYLETAKHDLTTLTRSIETAFKEAFDFGFEGNLLTKLTYLEDIDGQVNELNNRVETLSHKIENSSTSQDIISAIKDVSEKFEKHNISTSLHRPPSRRKRKGVLERFKDFIYTGNSKRL